MLILDQGPISVKWRPARGWINGIVITGLQFGYGESGAARPFTGDITGTEADLLYRMARRFPGVRGCYRIPLPAGGYRVTLSLAEVY
jgi:hypothetical protein